MLNVSVQFAAHIKLENVQYIVGEQTLLLIKNIQLSLFSLLHVNVYLPGCYLISE